MTRAPRSRAEPRTPTTDDMERMFTRFEGKLTAAVDELKDGQDRLEAKGDARQEITTRAIAALQAGQDAIKEDVARVGRRGEEILATSTRGYRELDKTVSDKLSDTNLRVEAMEVAGAAADKAAQGAEQRIAPGVHRGAGYAKIGAGGIGFVSILAIWNWVKVNGHDVIVWGQYLGKAVGAMLKGLAGVQPPPS